MKTLVVQSTYANGRKEYSIISDMSRLPERTRRIMTVLFEGTPEECFSFWKARLAAQQVPA
jgi:hypothetical protein